jgi:hypothetical protein
MQDRYVVCAKYTIGSEIILEHPMELLGEWVLCNLISPCLEIVLVSVQYRCTVCAERTIGSEIVLDAHNGKPGSQVSSGSSFHSFCKEC